MSPDLNGGPPFDRRGAAPLPAGAEASFVLLLTICARQALLSTATYPQLPWGSITQLQSLRRRPASEARTGNEQGEKTHWAWSHNRLQQCSCGRLARLDRLRLGLLWLARAACRAAGLLQCHSGRRPMCLLIGPAESMQGLPALRWEAGTNYKAYGNAQVALSMILLHQTFINAAQATDRPTSGFGVLMGSWQPEECPEHCC